MSLVFHFGTGGSWKVLGIGRLEGAWCRWLSLYEDSWQRRFSSNAHEDTPDSDCDSPRALIWDFQSTQDLRVLDHAWYRWLQFVEHRRCYSSSCSSCSDDSFTEGMYDDVMEFGCYPLRSLTQDCLPPQHIKTQSRHQPPQQFRYSSPSFRFCGAQDQVYPDTDEGRSGTVRAIGNCHNLLPRTPILECTTGSRKFCLSDVPERR